MSIPYRRETIDSAGAKLAVGRWGTGELLVLASHGITANHLSWQSVAEALVAGSGGRCSLLALDHRGRAGSAVARGPYGLERHADDLVAVLDHYGAESAVFAGHSMGAFVVTLAAERHPDRCTSLVLVDGGLPIAIDLPLGGDVDVEALVRAVIGPALARLERSWPDIDAYVRDFAAHPAFQAPNPFPASAADYMRYDAVTDDAGEVRSSVVKDAVIEDGGALIVDPACASAIERIETPSHFIWAPRGLVDQTPGLYAGDRVAAAVKSLPHLEAELVDDCNHYTILLDSNKSAAVVEALLAAVPGAA